MMEYLLIPDFSNCPEIGEEKS